MTAGALALGLGAVAPLGGAVAAPDFYKGKRIHHCITSGSGGSVDLKRLRRP